MLDFRIQTFLAVYKYKSYTKAAEHLNLTQPAVSQQIQHLENEYGSKLIEYSSRTLKLTLAGELFLKYCMNAAVNESMLTKKINEAKRGSKSLSFAATMTIGEFTLESVIAEFTQKFSAHSITMYVDNTQAVTDMLHEGSIMFALVEGLFSKTDFKSRLYKMARFIAVASCENPLALKKEVQLDELLDHRLIIREKGSGSREILERGLFDKNFTLESFESTIEIGNVNIMKTLVKSSDAVSFMYEDCVRKEIKEGSLKEIKISGFDIMREFNFIYVENDIINEELDEYYEFFLSRLG